MQNKFQNKSLSACWIAILINVIKEKEVEKYWGPILLLYSFISLRCLL